MTPAARVYLDWNATTPPLRAVLDAMVAAGADAWGNPASIHAHGRAARARVEDARAAVGALAGADPRDIVLTSGGTEANNVALRSAFADGKGGALVTSRLEHPSVLRVAEALAREGAATLRLVEIRADGRLDLDDLARALADTTTGGGVRLVALQSVNHETGVIQPVDEAAALVAAVSARAGRRTVRLHVDAVQAFGRLAFLAPAADTRSLAAHKMRGPKGIGALVARPGLTLAPVLLGGAQEKGIRPGTGDPVAAAGLAVAAAYAATGPARYAEVAALRDALEAALLALGGDRVHVNGTAPRAPHVTNLAWDGWNGAELVAALDLEGVSVSSGSACSAGTIEPSPVLTAMLGPARAASSVRISLGDETTRADVDAAVAVFTRVVGRR